jgi:tetratricopeptide (TPR) repeat protein
MILRLSSNARRAVLVAAAFAVALILSYFSIRNALAVHYAGLQTPESYEHAARLEPADPRNWYLLGRYWQYNLEDPDSARAIRSYLSALSLNPASAETRVELATAYESESNLAAARDAYLRAKNAYPLSAEISWRYGNFLLRQGSLTLLSTKCARPLWLTPGAPRKLFPARYAPAPQLRQPSIASCRLLARRTLI